MCPDETACVTGNNHGLNDHGHMTIMGFSNKENSDGNFGSEIQGPVPGADGPSQ